MVVRDFSLPCSTEASNALINPYDVEASDTHAFNGDDDDTGGWLALHKRRHQKAFAPYVAAAVIAAAKRSPTPDNSLSRAQAEILRMALELEAESSDGNSVLAPTDSTVPSTSAGAGVVGGVVDGSATNTVGERLSKASFLERCGKAIARKRSFWKKKEEN